MFKRLLPVILLFVFSITLYAQPGKPLTTGKIICLDDQLKSIIPSTAKIEVIASGLSHVEGPVWVRDSSCLLMSDTKAQVIYRWSDAKGLSKFLTHTGYTGRLPYSEEPGSNGLAVNTNGELLICEHGDRRIAVYPLNGKYSMRTLTDNCNGKRYNSPNDVIVKSDGSIYFTDPPYGLPQQENDATRENKISGVYRADKSGHAELLTGDIPYANGLAFSPDEKLLYISNSDVNHSYIMKYEVLPDGRLGTGRMFFDADKLTKEQDKQVTDGLKVDNKGNIWASGPGGLLIISLQGKLLGRIETYEVISNCVWDTAGQNLYMTAGPFLYRLALQ